MKSIKIDDIANLQLKFDTSRFVNIDWSCNLNQEILKNLEIKLLNAKNTIETMDLILLSESIVSEVACFKRSKDKNNIVLDEEALNQQLFGNLRKPGGATYEKIKSYWILHKGLIYSDQVRAKFKEYPSSYISEKIGFLSPSTNVASVNEAIRDERVKAEADFLSFTKISFDNYQLKIKELAGWEKYIYCCPWALFSLIALGVLFNFSFWGFIGLIFWAFIANFSANFLAKMVSTKIKENTIENFLDSMQT